MIQAKLKIFKQQYTVLIMELAIEEINKEEEQLSAINEQLQNRAEKFGSEYKPMTLSDFKMFKIRKAQETGNITYLQNILLEEIQDLQERKQKIKERIQQFYPELKVQSQQKFFEERQTPNFQEPDVQTRENAWSLFGVDYMSNEMIRNYFNINPHFKIQWINDSSCNLVFQSAQEATEAVMPLVRGEGMRDENEVWYQLPEYEVEGTKRKLYCRVATSKDVKKKDCHGHKSQYYQWQINKRKLNTYVKKKAHSQIMKTKGINRQNRYHMQKKGAIKKKEESQSSSSGVDDSEDMDKK